MRILACRNSVTHRLLPHFEILLVMPSALPPRLFDSRAHLRRSARPWQLRTGTWAAGRMGLNRMGLHEKRMGLHQESARRNSAGACGLGGREITVLALMISFPVVGLDKFLRTASGRFSAQPYVQAGHWLTDSLIMLPLFAIGVWAGDRIAGLAGLCTARRADALKRALVITLLAALAQVPAWFAADRSDNPVTAQPIVAPQAHDSGDVYWVAPWVILALVCVCLAPVAVWAARTIGRGITSHVAVSRPWTGPPRGAAAVTRAAPLVLLLAVTPVLAWVLHQAAERAYASQVYYTSGPPAITRHSRPFSPAARAARHPASAPVTAAPFASVYQAAHALQDGLAGQAAGLPVTVIALLRVTRGLDGRNQHHPADTQGGVE
jgi:hypothetical protein